LIERELVAKIACMSAISLRLATSDDLEAINSIYNHYVLCSTCTYQTEPEAIEARRAWFAAHGAAHPVTVAERQGLVVGWGSLSRFHARAAYGRTVENSVYVHHEHLRQQIGRMVLVDLIARAKAAGHHAIIAGIDAEQHPSVALHGSQGFVHVGRLTEVGFKFGRWLDVIYMELQL
jgi:L-amino acid N-acyltransferase YncA